MHDHRNQAREDSNPARRMTVMELDLTRIQEGRRRLVSDDLILQRNTHFDQMRIAQTLQQE